MDTPKEAEVSPLEGVHDPDPNSAQSSFGSENDSETDENLSDRGNHDSEAEFGKDLSHFGTELRAPDRGAREDNKITKPNESKTTPRQGNQRELRNQTNPRKPNEPSGKSSKYKDARTRRRF